MESSGWAVSAALLLHERDPIPPKSLAERVTATGFSQLGVRNVKGVPSQTLRTQLTVRCPHTDWFSVSGGFVELVDRAAAAQDAEVREVLATLSGDDCGQHSGAALLPGGGCIGGRGT